MQTRLVLFFLTILFLLPFTAQADNGLGFTISPMDVNIFAGDMFTISATVFNPSATQTYTVGDVGNILYTGNLGDFVFVDYGADYGNVTNRSYAPGATATAPEFLRFSTDNATPTGDYTATVQLNDGNSATAAQASFNIHILAVPEFGTTLSVAGLLGAGAFGMYRQRRQRRSDAVK